MQIIKYEIDKSRLTVGFKEDVFVVYAQIPYDNTKTKEYLLQKAYEQVKSAIEYENTLTEHSFTTDETGEEFTPEMPKASKVIIDNVINYFSCLQTGDLTQQFTAKVYDQYGDVISKSITFSFSSTPANVTLNNGLLTVGQAEGDYDLTLTASCEGVTDALLIYVRKYVEPTIPPKTEPEKLQEQIDINAGAIDFIVMNF
jgi:hypothetical protein